MLMIQLLVVMERDHVKCKSQGPSMKNANKKMGTSDHNAQTKTRSSGGDTCEIRDGHASPGRKVLHPDECLHGGGDHPRRQHQRTRLYDVTIGMVDLISLHKFDVFMMRLRAWRRCCRSSDKIRYTTPEGSPIDRALALFRNQCPGEYASIRCT
jgi:hypothetical protein